MQNQGSRRLHRNHILIGGLILYACAFAVLLRNKSFGAGDAVVVLIVFGIAFPLIAWVATRRVFPFSISIHPSTSELVVLIVYVLALSFYLVGGPQWIDQHLPSSWVDSARIKFFIVLAKKLLVLLLFLSRSFDSASVTGFALSEFRARVYARFATVICPLSLLLAALFLLSNIFSAAAQLRFDSDTLPPINCFSVCCFASFGFSSKPD